MAKSQTIVMAILAILGLSAIGGGLYLGNYVHSQLNTGIKDSLVVDPNFATKDPKGYKDWLTNTDPNDNPKYRKYYMWNLTNPDEYLAGGEPVMKQIGPYSYRQYDIKVGVSITSTEVTYNTFTYYRFDPSTSFDGANPDTDQIININPQYLGVIQNAGSEAALVTGFVGPAIQQIMDGLNSQFPYSVKANGMQTIFDGLNTTFVQNLPYSAGAQGLAEIIGGLTTDFAQGAIVQGLATKVLPEVHSGVEENLGLAINGTTAAQLIGQTLDGVAGATNLATALDTFFNSTTFQTTFTTPIQGVSEYNSVGLSISAATADKLLYTGSPSYGVPYGWLQDNTTGTGVLAFMGLYQQALTNPTLKAAAEADYGFQAGQFDAVANYILNHLFEDVVQTTVAGTYGIGNTAATANIAFYMQWTNTSFTSPLDLNGDYSPDGFEVGAPGNITLTEAMTLWNPSSDYSFTNVTSLGIWLMALQNDPGSVALLSSAFPRIFANTTILAMLGGWLTSFMNGFATTEILASAGASTVSDLGYVQWGNNTLTDGVSVASLDPTITAPIEFWYYEQANMTLANVTALFTGPYNLTDATGLGTFMLLGSQALAGNATADGLLTATFGTTLKATELGKLLDYLQNVLIDNIVLSQLPVTTYADAGYYQWANGTITGGVGLQELDPVNVPGPISFWNVTGSSLSLDNSKALFGGDYSLVTGSGIGALDMYLYGAGHGNNVSLATINTLFGTTLTESDALNLAAYLNFTYTYLILPQLPVSSYSDLGYYQWANSTLTEGLSVYQIDPTGLPGTVEYWASAGMNMSLANAKQLLNGTNNLMNSTLVGVALSMATAFATAYASSDTATMVQLTTAFNTEAGSSLAPGEFGGLLTYLKHVYDQFVINATLNPIFAAGGGLISTRTPTEWLFKYQDPLLTFLKDNGIVSDASGNVFSNPPLTELATAANASTADTYKTGGDSLDNVGQYVKWNGLSEIQGIWLAPEVIKGTDGTLFHPDVKKTELLDVFTSDLMRVITFEYQKDVKVEGINLMQFVLTQATLAVNANYFQTVKGLANMTSAAGVPLFLSKPNFLDADPTKTSDLVGGMNPDAALHDTFLDVEPITGAVLSAAKRLQLNFQVGAGDVFTSNVTKSYVPLLWVDEGGTITPSLANDFKAAVYGAQRLEQVAQWGGPAIGIILLMSAAVMMVRRKP